MTTGKWITLGVLAAGGYYAYTKRKVIKKKAIETLANLAETWDKARSEFDEAKRKKEEQIKT